MRFNSVLAAFVNVIVLVAAVAKAADAPYAGKFSDGTLSMDLSGDASGYTGLITLAQKQYPAKGRAEGNGLIGTFDAGGFTYNFTATLADNTLTVVTGSRTYALKRQDATPPPNPLGGMAVANPAPIVAPAGNAAVGDVPPGNAPAGYDVLTSTSVGQSLMAHKANVTTIKAALEAVFPELAQYFGIRPVIGQTYQDVKNPTSGGATFTVELKGQSNQGFVKCNLGEGGATIAVIYGLASAPKSEWDTLLNPMTDAEQASVPAIPMKTYSFPDGTGSIGLPEGYTTKTQSATDPVLIAGPAGQEIVLNYGRNINLPNSLAVRNRQTMQLMQDQQKARLEESYKQLERVTGRPAPRPAMRPPPPMPPLIVSPLLEPVDALKAIVPQFSALSEFNHGSTTAIEQIVSSKSISSPFPNGKGAEIVYDYSQTTSGKTEHYRRLLRLITSQSIPDAWFWYVNAGLGAPAQTYEHDIPVMSAIVKSLKIDQDRMAQVGQAKIEAMKRAGEVFNAAMQKNSDIMNQMAQDNAASRSRVYQAQHQAQMDSYAKHNQQWAVDEWQKQRNAANFQEYIIGSRTVYDTKTNQSASVDLSYANGVARSLNEATLDPNRFVAVPLRDELYPNPPPAPAR